ncbi:MAG: hybrid sensory histidine kinase BarA [Methanomassiliicoccales archaeon PtaU1.Bin124]|nr:MAG: hybrid sensory histidine kinase BarA [Methanomassiliicoccales archaeon PtaU1.Bin124]
MLMKLQSRILTQFLIVGVMVMAIIAVMLPSALRNSNVETVKEGSLSQLYDVDFALTTFVTDVKNDVRQLSMNDVIRTENDSNFTNFLNSTGENFTYSNDATEQEIISLLRDYQDSHPYVNSVYMGRENGAFVRAYPRAQPTQYDPRTRPWYTLGVDNPGVVAVTEPYSSLTTPDLNIGIVTALIDGNDHVYGVIGADITLKNLTDYISTINTASGGSIILTNYDGTIIAANDASLLFTDVKGVLGDDAVTLLNDQEGMVDHNRSYIMFHTSSLEGWKIASFVPYSVVDEKVYASMASVIVLIVIALVLLSVIVLISFRYTVVKPLTDLTQVTQRITETGDLDQKIEVHSSGEIATLGQSFNTMVGKLDEEKKNREMVLKELENYRDHFEELVEARTKELAIAKEAAESADRLKSAFLATMSHELRTPLNSIIGFTGIMQQELAGPLNDEQKKQMGMVSDSAEHLLALINDVLILSKIEAGQLTLAKTEFDLRSSIAKVIATTELMAKRKGIFLEYRIGEDIGKVRGDSRRVEQILLNLVSNGIKFTEKGSVRVECHREGKDVVMSVIDTGIGISQADMDKLFKPFSQVETGLTRHYEGTGLGLSICQKLTDMMGGSIGVESTVGIGTTFRVRLPIIMDEMD